MIDLFSSGTSTDIICQNACASDGSMLSMDKLLSIRINLYVTINTKDIGLLIDTVGEVDANNLFEFTYDGKIFSKVNKVLNVEELLKYLSIRNDKPNDDYGPKWHKTHY